MHALHPATRCTSEAYTATQNQMSSVHIGHMFIYISTHIVRIYKIPIRICFLALVHMYMYMHMYYVYM